MKELHEIRSVDNPVRLTTMATRQVMGGFRITLYCSGGHVIPLFLFRRTSVKLQPGFFIK